jgi:hypothetical protein
MEVDTWGMKTRETGYPLRLQGKEKLDKIDVRDDKASSVFGGKGNITAVLAVHSPMVLFHEPDASYKFDQSTPCPM